MPIHLGILIKRKSHLCQEQTARMGLFLVLVENNQTVVGLWTPYRVGKGNGLAIVNGCGIDAATLELVDECLVVVGSHRGPASFLHLGVENG